MPLYVGIPITCSEAFRIFGIDIDKASIEIMDKYKLKREPSDFMLADYLNEIFVNKSASILLYPTDKEYFIIGYQIMNSEYIYMGIDETVTTLLHNKFLFAKDISLLDADLSNVKIQNAEGYTFIMSNPSLYVINTI